MVRTQSFCSDIRTLADTQTRGSLDLTDFIIGMYLIQSCMANSTLQLPPTLPPGTYEAASGGRSPASPIVRQNTGPASPIRPQYTGGMQPQRTGQPGTPTRSSTLGNWDVTADAKATSDRFFAQLDPQNRGFIEGDVAVPFMLQSQLDEGTLASIWDLADIRKEGRLNNDEFAVAMHLINAKLAGRDPPATLPTSLVPPALRGEYSQQPQAQPSSTTKDLFDLFADEPITAPTPSFPTAPVPPRSAVAGPVPARSFASPPPVQAPPAVRSPPPADLMGEEAQPLPDHSAEIGNKRNQLENTNRGLDSLQKERPNLEKAAESSAAELKDLEEKLAAARSKHESETKAVADLKSRVSEQKEKIQSINMDYIAAQSDVSALQSERDELEQALLSGKEEVRDLNRRMKEIAEEKSGLQLLLEKLKKESRQQKGMVSIAKKQLATAEGGRDGVQGEIKVLEKEAEQVQTPQAAAVPLPATPRALSPAATGVSQRSNNPFDRFKDNKSPAASFGAGAILGAAAGVVVAGAETLYEAAKDVVSPTEESAQVHEVAEHTREPHAQPSTDFDSAFAEYDEPSGIPSGIPKSAIPHLRPDTGRTASTQAVLGESVPDSPASTAPSAAGPAESSLRRPLEQDDSSDEDEGPEDVEAPVRYMAKPDNTPILYPPVERDTASIEAPKPRRSAPPPPPKATTVDDLDPFGGDSNPFTGQSAKEPEATGTAASPVLADQAVDDMFGDAAVAEPRQSKADTDPFGASLQSDAPATGQGFGGDDFAAPQSLGGPDFAQPPASAGFEDAFATPAHPHGSEVAGAQAPSGFSGFGDDDFTLQDAPAVTSENTFASRAVVDHDASRASPGFAHQNSGQATGFVDDDFSGSNAGAFAAPTPSGFDSAFASDKGSKSEPGLPPGAAPAATTKTTSGFDDDDFDFSDAPPVQMSNEASAPKVATSGKDDFDFDDEFEQPSNSDGSKSYEMVSPPSGGLAPPIQQPADVWGVSAPSGAPAKAAPPANAFSFDDAFGGDLQPPAQS